MGVNVVNVLEGHAAAMASDPTAPPGRAGAA